MCAYGYSRIGALAIWYKTCSSAAEDIVPDAFERAFSALGLHHLLLGKIEPDRLHIGDYFTVLFQVGVDFHEDGLYAAVGKHPATAGEYFVFESINVDLDVVRHRHH